MPSGKKKSLYNYKVICLEKESKFEDAMNESVLNSSASEVFG